jgi:hypothetical protein
MELEMVSKMGLEESVLQVAPRDVLASDAIVKSAAKVDEGVASRSNMRKRKRHSACLAIVTVVVEKVSIHDGRKGALHK